MDKPISRLQCQSSWESSWILLLICSATIAFFAPHKVGGLVIGFAGLCVAIAVVARFTQLLHVSTWIFFWFLILALVPASRSWPWQYLVPLLAYGLLVISLPSLRRSVGWWRWGRFSRAIVRNMLIIILLASMALLLWYWLVQPPLSEHRLLFSRWAMHWLPLAALGFALGNAIMEEVIFRGILLQSLSAVFGPGMAALAIQAFCFGALHYLAGFPHHWVGVLMTFVYGLALGYLRLQSQGLMVPILTHAAADLLIFAVLAMTGLQGDS